MRQIAISPSLQPHIPRRKPVTLEPEQVRQVCAIAAAEIVKPGAWVRAEVAVDAAGNSADVFDGATARDGLGTILKVSRDVVGTRANSTEVGYRVAEIIDTVIRLRTHGRFRLTSVSDIGANAMAATFQMVAASIGKTLPPIFCYAKDGRYFRWHTDDEDFEDIGNDE